MRFVKGLLVVLIIAVIFLGCTAFVDKMSGGKISSKVFSGNFRLQTVSSEMFQGIDTGNNLF